MSDQGTLEPYLFYGVVRPERAPFSLQYSIPLAYQITTTDREIHSLTVDVSILKNQIAVTVAVDGEIKNIFDLRNFVKGIIQDNLAVAGFIKGYAYDFEITRVINRYFGIDFVFGIEIPVLEERNKAIDLQARFEEVLQKTIRPHGEFLNVCFSNLVAAMKDPDNSPFFCYRAIESLRHHCAETNNLAASKEKEQWERFREISGCERYEIEKYKKYSDNQRHGKPGGFMSDQERADLFVSTWKIVDAYLARL